MRMSIVSFISASQLPLVVANRIILEQKEVYARLLLAEHNIYTSITKENKVESW